MNSNTIKKITFTLLSIFISTSAFADNFEWDEKYLDSLVEMYDLGENVKNKEIFTEENLIVFFPVSFNNNMKGDTNE